MVAQANCPFGNLPDPSCWYLCQVEHICLATVSRKEAQEYFDELYPDPYSAR